MALRLCALAAAAPLALVAAAPRELRGYNFQQYLNEFGKSYEGEEFVRREAIFRENLGRIHSHNADGSKTWYAAPNPYTDMTPQEFQGLKSRGTRPTYAPHLLRAAPPSLPPSKLPAVVDWRKHNGVVTPVKDQGGCGSCWAFSAVETLESHLAIATGKPAPVLSPQQLVSCAPNPNHCGGTGGCSGSTQWLGFNYTVTGGISLESSYPYQGETGTCNAGKIKPVAKNTGYVRLPTNDYDALMTAVATAGPVSISLAAGAAAWQLYGGGIFTTDSCGFDVDHGVQLVGYGAENGTEYWIVRNSWGPNWGEGGFIRIKRNGKDKEPCGVDSTPQDGSACAGDTAPVTYCGLCAILSDSSYPVGVKPVGEEEIVV